MKSTKVRCMKCRALIHDGMLVTPVFKYEITKRAEGIGPFTPHGYQHYSCPPLTPKKDTA